MFSANRQMIVSGVFMAGVMVFLGASMAGGQAAVPRIAVVDMQDVLDKYGQRNASVRALEEELNKLRDEVQQASAEMERRRQAFEESRPRMTEAQRLEEWNKLDQAYADQRIRFETRQRTLDHRRESVMREVIENVESIVSRISQQENYDLVLNKKSSAVVWASPAMDITPRVEAALQ